MNKQELANYKDLEELINTLADQILNRHELL